MSIHYWSDDQESRARDMFRVGDDDATIAAAVGRSARAVKAWRNKRHLHRPRSFKTPVPDDFVAFYTAHTIEECEAHWNRSSWTIQRWAKDMDMLKVPVKKTGAPLPEHFEQVACSLSIREAMAHFGAGEFIVRRWYKVTGVTPYKRLTRVSSRTANWGAPASPMRIEGDGTLAGQAAQVLRRFHANVYRATILDAAQRKHLPDAGRDHYFVAGKGFLLVQEMVALAEAKGFRCGVAA